MAKKGLKTQKNEVVDIGVKSLLPHKRQNSPQKGLFLWPNKKGTQKGHIFNYIRRMRPPSEPVINRTQPNKWFIEWNHDVPFLLWDKYSRKRIRIKRYPDINRYKGEERERYAQEQLKIYHYMLFELKYNPFEEELQQLEYYHVNRASLLPSVTEIEEKHKAGAELPEEDKRKLLGIAEALEAFMESRRKRKLAKESITAYQGTVDWLGEGLAAMEYIHLPIGELRYIHISAALSYISEEREWVATTINKEIDFLNTVFNWLETEDYVLKSPIKNKFIKLPAAKSRHTWYDRDLFEKVVNKIIELGDEPLLRACQFTYLLLIRSKKELRNLKIGDIDTSLKRIRFRTDLDLAKSKREDYRDYSAFFEAVYSEMGLANYPADYYVFSAEGKPGPRMVSHNYFSKRFFKVKEAMALGPEYTIYGFKHTRIVHELMRGTDGKHISYLARHTDFKTTLEYARDYDISLANVYKESDLRFYGLLA
jgi:site-specific recombinase XerD